MCDILLGRQNACVFFFDESVRYNVMLSKIVY